MPISTSQSIDDEFHPEESQNIVENSPPVATATITRRDFDVSTYLFETDWSNFETSKKLCFF